MDDQERFTKPVLNPDEVLIALGEKPWEEYARDNNAQGKPSERAETIDT